MYITAPQFAERFGQEELDQLTVTNGGIQFDSAVADAQAIVDSYLAAIPERTFPIPLTVPPARIAGVTADLTRYELWANRASEEVRNRRDQAIEYLRDLVAGRAVLIVDTVLDPEPIVSPIGRVGFRTNGRVFTDRTLGGFAGYPDGCCVDPLGGLRGCD